MRKFLAFLLAVSMMISAIPVMAAEMTVIFSDKFDGNLSQWSINADTAAKASIKEYAGNKMLFINGKASSKTLLASISKQCENISLESDFALDSAGGYVGWLVRYSGAGAYLVQICPDNTLKIYKQTATTGSGFSLIASQGVSIEPGKIYNMRIDAIGTKITAYLDGSQIISVEDSDLTVGGFGLRTLSADVYFDNIVYKSEGLSTQAPAASFGGAGKVVESDYPAIKEGTTKEMFEQRVAELPKEIPLKTPAAITGSTQIFVSPSGNDGAAGTVDQPLKTLKTALDRARSGNPSDTVVYMRGGDYSVTDTVKIDAGLSGIKISAYNGENVRLVGGRFLQSSQFTPVAGTDVAQRFPLSARDKIKVLDLEANGINDYGEIVAGGYYLGDGVLPVELFYNNAKMTLSRWPNDGNVAIRDVIDEGNAPAFEGRAGTVSLDDGRGFEFKILEDRPFNWASDEDIWLYGAYSREWAVARIKVKDIKPETKSIRTVHASPYGAVQGCEFYFLNVMDELDMPGEFYIDRVSKKLYMYPFGDQSTDTITYSSLKNNMFEITDANNVVINGISLEAGMGDGIFMKNVKGTSIQGVSIKNMGGNGINGSSCYDTTVLSCDLTAIAKNGIVIGGNSWTLKKNNNYIQNNYLTDIGNDNDGVGIQMNGTGNVASHNSIHVLETSALRFNGCENIMEYNEFGDTMRRVEDGGSIYTHSQFLVRGNHIRYNFIHDFYGYDSAAQGGPHAIYLDNLTSDNYVYGNTLIDGKAPIHHTWGREVVVANNIIAGQGRSTTSYYSIVDQDIMQLSEGLSYFEKPEQNRYKPFDENGYPYGDFKALTNNIPYLSDAWVSRYPRLKNLNTDEWWIPKYGYYDSNVIYDHADIRISENRIKYGQIVDTKLTKNDPFVDYAGGNYNINLNSQVMKEYPNFDVPPSFEKAGIVLDDALRTTKPGLGTVALTYPENLAGEIGVGSVDLRWTKATGADYYNVEVATDPEMKNIVISKKTENNYVDVNVDGLGKRYYWRVTANTRMNSIDKTPAVSPVWAFTTQTVGTATEELIRAAEQILTEYGAAGSKYEYSADTQAKLKNTINEIREKGVSQWGLSDVETMRTAVNEFLMNAEMLEVVNDKFSGANVGSYPSGYTESTRGTMTVEAVDGTHAIKIVDNITDNYAVLPRSFDSVTGSVELSFRIKPMQTNCMMYLKVRQDGSTDPVVVSLSNSGKICIGSGFDAGKPITSYQAGRWYDFKLNINSLARTFSLSVNGEELIPNRKFDDKFYESFENKNYLNGIVITTGSPMEDTGEFYFADLKIATANLPDAELVLNDAIERSREQLWSETLSAMGDRLVIAIDSPRAASKDGLVYIDSTNTKVVPYAKNNRTLVPIRFLSEHMKAKVDWDNDTKTVTIQLSDREVKMQLGKTEFYINGALHQMDVAPEASNGRTFVPIRAAAEALGVKIDYSPLGLVCMSNTDNAFSTMKEMFVLKLASHLK